MIFHQKEAYKIDDAAYEYSDREENESALYVTCFGEFIKCKSNSDGRRLIQGGAVALNDEKITDASAAVGKDTVASAPVLRAGKKNMRRLKLG